MLSHLFESFSKFYGAIKEVLVKIDYAKVKNCCSIPYMKKWWWTLVYKMKNIKQTNYDLGIYHFIHENYNDALFRLRMLEWWNKGPFNSSRYYIGLCYYKVGKKEKATTCLQQYLESLPARGSDTAKNAQEVLRKMQEVEGKQNVKKSDGKSSKSGKGGE